ncbi:hypothetical protein [Rhodovulum euryhalinum]|nr:hypothetical protein [Rhodovulum euryhalinum]
MNKTLVLGALALSGLAGCVETTTSGAPSAAEQACLRDVSRAANNGDVIVQSSSFSEAGTEVIVGVGAGEYGRAPWRCIAYRDGTTAGIQYIGGGEGGL